MLKKLALALPLASLLFVVGCCTDDSCNTCAIGPAPVVAAVEVQDEALVSEAVTVDEEVEVAVVEEEEEVAEEAPKAPVAPRATAASCPSVIPTDTLPEGWDYFSETELAGGALNTQSIEELYASK